MYLRRKPWRSQTFVLRRANIYVIYMVLAMRRRHKKGRKSDLIAERAAVCVGLLRADEQSARAV